MNPVRLIPGCIPQMRVQYLRVSITTIAEQNNADARYWVGVALRLFWRGFDVFTAEHMVRFQINTQTQQPQGGQK